ncbi:hypothetical protein ACROYT_G041493 [Oculina patagonica]
MVVCNTMFRPAKICAIYLAIALLVFAILDRSDAFSASLNTARLQGRRRTLSEVFSRGSRSFCDTCSKICSPPPWQQEGRKPSGVISQHQTPVHAQPTQQPYHTKEEMEIGRREEDMHFNTEHTSGPFGVAEVLARNTILEKQTAMCNQLIKYR